MIGLPHRVGAAYVILGQSNGTEPRLGHVLNENVYGDGSTLQYHTYFGNYPVLTTPDYIITKTAGTLGEDYFYNSPTSQDIPGNILKLVSYKTELNHFIPTLAAGADSNTPSYDSEGLWQAIPPPLGPGSSGYYLPIYDLGSGDYIEYNYIDNLTQFTSFVSSLKASWTEITDVTDNIDGDVEGFTSSTFYPRWTAESEYEQTGLLNPPISVTIEDDPTFYQTREGPGMTPPEDQSGTYWICPWTVGRVGGGLNQRLKIDQNVSYKFTKDGDHADSSVAWKIVYPWGKGPFNPSTDTYVPPPYANTRIADESPRLKNYGISGQYSDKIIAGSYRTAFCTIYPALDGEEFAYVNYENKSTHGLFLAANGSCWNIGTELKVKVHIWKCPPRFCLYYRNKDKDGGGYPYDNWRRGLEATLNAVYDGGYPYVVSRIIGPATGTSAGGDFRFEGGLNTGVDYSIPEPKSMDLHYWGTVFTLDTDSELNVEHEVQEFTITIGEDNTYYCDGTPREEVEMTPEGFKIADVVIPPVEGYITYIKDFEVTSVKKPPTA